MSDNDESCPHTIIHPISATQDQCTQCLRVWPRTEASNEVLAAQETEPQSDIARHTAVASRDALALDIARRVTDAIDGRDFKGGRVQLQAAIQVAVIAYLEGSPNQPGPMPRFRHKIQGGEYTLLFRDITLHMTSPLRDRQTLCLYAAADGSLHARSLAEFSDGRFEQLDETAQRLTLEGLAARIRESALIDKSRPDFVRLGIHILHIDGARGVHIRTSIDPTDDSIHSDYRYADTEWSVPPVVHSSYDEFLSWAIKL